MKRLIQPVLRGCIAVACMASSMASSAMADNVSFATRPRYNGVPGAGTSIVVYNLPLDGSIYAGPVNASFDLVAEVDGDGVETAAGFGLIANLAGTGEVVFNPPAIVNDANNLTAALNPSPSFPANTSFDYLFASTGIQGGGTREIDITAFEQVALQNNTVTDGDGLLSVPIQVGAGVTGSFNVNFNVSSNYTGFVKTLGEDNTQFLTNAGAFPHVGTTITVRQSRRGDLNGDVLLDGEDIAPFIAVLSNTPGFRTANPWLQVSYITDFNQDTFIDGEDISGFITALSGGGSPSASPAAIPEPSSIVLGLLGAAGLYFARRRVQS